MANRVEQRGVMGHYPPVPNEDGIALHKPVILVLSILASIVAYKNVSEKNRKPIAGVILGAGVSYSVGLCKILRSVASILEKEDDKEDEQHPHVPLYPPPQQGLHYDPHQGSFVDGDGYEVKEQGLGGSRPQMKGHPGSQQQHGHRLDRPQQKEHPWE